MTRNKTGNNKFLKDFNQKVILDLIRTQKTISKSEISRITGLSPTAAGLIVSTLLEKGYIHETGTGESKGGRKPVLLELKPDSFYSIGIDLDIESFNIILIDITGRIVQVKSVNAKGVTLPEDIVIHISAEVKNLVESCGFGFERLIGIGISIPGMVDSQTHKVVFAPNLGWRDVDIVRLLSMKVTVPVYVENEAMASAVCENWLGSCQNENDFVCINVKSGIGAGIFTGGKLYRGAGGSAGEVGHIVVDENGPRCGCGNYGCLETMASTSYIIDKARRLVRQGVVSSLNQYGNIEDIDLDKIIHAARSGDEAAKGILAEAARYMGIAISNIVNTLNPSRIVIGREFVKYADLVMEHIKGVVDCKALKAPASGVHICASDIGENTSVLGAAIIPLKVLFGR